MRILAIETSCDETAIAVVKASGGLRNPSFVVEKNIVASQVKTHAPFGGVVPNLAKREHIKNLPLLFKRIFKNSEPELQSSKLDQIDLMAVTVGPGLEPALWTGIDFAKRVHKDIFRERIPLLGANHLEGHLYSFLLSQKSVGAKSEIGNSGGGKTPKAQLKNFFPVVSLVVSGGHTILALIEHIGHYRKLGETKDDAIGESFDKVARLLALPYPGGPHLEKMAREGDPNAVRLPSPLINSSDFDFSYSGLKTAVLYYLRDQGIPLDNFSPQKEGKKISQILKKKGISADLAASFQEAALKVLVKKTMRAVEKFQARAVAIGGGVAANNVLRDRMETAARENVSPVSLFVPPFEFCQDNAVMIASAAYVSFLKKRKLPLIADGNLNL